MSADGSPPADDWIHKLLARHEGGLLRCAQRITGDAERAREVVQDTFLKLTQRTQEELDGHATEWLYTVCRNRAVDVHRKERRMAAIGETEAVAVRDTQPPPDRLVESREHLAHVVAWLDDLPDRQREIIVLRFNDGLTYRQIGEELGLTVSNVGFLLHNGMRTLRARMRREETDVPPLPPSQDEQ